MSSVQNLSIYSWRLWVLWVLIKQFQSPGHVTAGHCSPQRPAALRARACAPGMPQRGSLRAKARVETGSATCPLECLSLVTGALRIGNGFPMFPSSVLPPSYCSSIGNCDFQKRWRINRSNMGLSRWNRRPGHRLLLQMGSWRSQHYHWDVTWIKTWSHSLAMSGCHHVWLNQQWTTMRVFHAYTAIYKHV